MTLTTNILLAIVIILLLARVIIEVRSGKRAVEKTYAAASEVENVCYFRTDETWSSICELIKDLGKHGYELVCVQSNVVIGGETGTMTYFTRRKIKNYMEE